MAAKGNGLFINGMIMGKSVFEHEKGNKYNLDIACPDSGLRTMVTVGVLKEIFDSVKSMDLFNEKITFSIFNGKTYFNHVPA